MEKKIKEQTTVTDIVKRYLEENGYDGLFASGICACENSDLFPCGSEQSIDCQPGYKIPCACGDNCPWDIGPIKPKQE